MVSICMLCVCMCLCGCGVVWCCSFLSFSLDRPGNGGSMATQQRRWRGAMAILQLPLCCGTGGSRRRSTYHRDILAYPDLSCRSPPSCFIVDCSNHCIMVFPCCVHPLILCCVHPVFLFFKSHFFQPRPAATGGQSGCYSD